MKVFSKIFLCIFLLLGINLYSQSNSNYKKGVSNILNAQNPDDIGIRSASQIQDDKDDPLEYGYVNDKDITTVVSAMSITLLKMGKITAQQAGEALVEVSKYLEEN